jgi:hypothetical protein
MSKDIIDAKIKVKEMDIAVYVTNHFVVPNIL